ncbi:MAG TPA: sensor histidine kinase [Candidatus Nanopelagicales bacterium]
MNTESLTQPLWSLRFWLQALVVVLLLLVAGRAVTGQTPNAAAVLITAVVMAVVTLAPLMWPRRSTSTLTSSVYLAVMVGVWLVLLWLTPEGVWLAFPLFFLQLDLLPLRGALIAVAATTIVAVAGFAWHQETVTPAAVIGPVIGAAVAVATALGYQALYRESEQRRLLIEELTATQADLAAAEHSAGVLAERERLAREIHDTLAQGLSSIQLLLRAAGRALPAHPDAAAEHVELARRTAQENLAEARRFVYALTPPDLVNGSLLAALERLCAVTAQQSGLAVRFHLEGTATPVPTSYEVALLRIAQSALANAVQHARATRVELTLTYMDTRIALDVVDDGVGFDPSPVPVSVEGGFGIAAMRARTAALGGTLSVESAPGQGTALAVSFDHQPDLTDSEGATADD